MTKFPPQFAVAASSGRAQYVLAAGYFAVPERLAVAAQLEVEFSWEGEGLCVIQGTPGPGLANLAAGEVTPVYRLGEQGPFAVPTGRVFLRFAESTSLSARQSDIERTGFVIQQALPYAPHAGWVTPRSGQIADALERFPSLAQLPGVQAVEPQMLLQRQRR